MLYPVEHLFELIVPPYGTALSPVGQMIQDVLKAVDDRLFKEGVPGDRIAQVVHTYDKEAFPQLDKYDAEAFRQAMSLILEVVHRDDSVPYLISRLRSISLFYAPILLGWFGSRARQALPQLLHVLTYSAIGAGLASDAIQRIGLDQTQAISYFRQLLEAEFPDRDAFYTMGSWLLFDLGFQNVPAFLEILEMASQHNAPLYRQAVADILIEIPVSERHRFSTIVERLKNDPDEQVREIIAKGVG